MRFISNINSVFKRKFFGLVLWPIGQGHIFHDVAWGTEPNNAYSIFFKSQFFLYS